MAWELPNFKPGGLKATSTLATKQFYCVKIDASNNNQVVICSAVGEVVAGILQNAPIAGGEAEIMMSGISKALVGTTVVAGDRWNVDANGKIEPTSTSNTAADVGDWVGGIVLEGAAAGEYATVTIGLHTAYVAA